MDFSKSIFLIFTLISVSHTSNISKLKLIPSIVLFDLDFVLWPYCVDTDIVPPIRFHKDGEVVIDAVGEYIRSYPEVPDIFKWLQNHRIPMGILTSSFAVKVSKDIIELFGWTRLFKIIEISSKDEDEAAKEISEKENIPLSEMLMFTGNPRTLRRLKTIGVTTEDVENGMNVEVFQKGLQWFKDLKILESQTRGPIESKV